MGEKTTKYPFVSEGEMMFGKKVRVKSKDILGFRDFFTRKGDKYELISDDVLEPKLYVMDYETVEKYKRIDKKGTNWISISKKSIPNIDDYHNNWNQIKRFLKINENQL